MSNAAQRAVEIEDDSGQDDENIVDQVETVDPEADEQEGQSTETTDAEGSDAAGETAADGEDDASGSDGADDEVVVSIGEESLPSSEPAPEWVKKLRKEHVELRRRNRELEEQIQAGKAWGAEPNPAPLPKKPVIEDFDYDTEAFATAFEQWTEQKRQHEAAQQAKRAEQEAQERAWQEKLAGYQSAKAALKVRDYEDAEAVAQTTLSVVQQGIIVQGADNPALVMYALGKNETRAKALAAITDPVKFAFAVAKLEKDMKVTSKAKTPPPPERTVSGHGRVASGGTDTTLEKLREEAARTGDMTKVIEYKRKLRDTKRG